MPNGNATQLTVAQSTLRDNTATGRTASPSLNTPNTIRKSPARPSADFAGAAAGSLWM